MSNENDRFKERVVYGGEATIKFDRLMHRYYINGKPALHSVSGIVGILDKPALIPWAVRSTIEIVKERLKPGMTIDDVFITGVSELAKGEHIRKRDEAADEGTRVHAMIEEWIIAWIKSTDGFKVTSESLEDLQSRFSDKPQALRLEIEQWVTWLKEHDVQFLDAERLVYSRKYEYPGTIDALAFVDGKLCILDHKIRSGVYSETRLTTAAYQWAEQEESGTKLHDRWVFHFGRKDGVFTGEFNAICYSYKDFKRDLLVFLSCLDIKNWKKQTGER